MSSQKRPDVCWRDTRRNVRRVLPQGWLRGHLYAPPVQPAAVQPPLLALHPPLPRLPRHCGAPRIYVKDARHHGAPRGACAAARGAVRVQGRATCGDAPHAHVRHRERLPVAPPRGKPGDERPRARVFVLPRRRGQRLFPPPPEDGACSPLSSSPLACLR